MLLSERSLSEKAKHYDSNYLTFRERHNYRDRQRSVVPRDEGELGG